MISHPRAGYYSLRILHMHHDSDQPAIRCQALHKHYRNRSGSVRAVNGLDLEVRPGECFGLLGPNGAGKTTTIEILEGLLDASSGEVKVLGMRWGEDDDELRQRMGISLQETRFSDKLSVRETLILFRSFYRTGMDPQVIINSVGLAEKASTWVGKLSGGQRQRLAVACALVGDPELLFLDEPTTGLDPQSRRQLWDIIRGFGERGKTTLLTTHYMDEAERLCARVAVVDQGRVIALGTPAELIAGLGGEHLVEFALANGKSIGAESLVSLPAVCEARVEAGGTALIVTEPHVAIPALLATVQSLGFEMIRLTTRHASLEDVFVRLTGRRLHDDQISPA